MIVSDTLSGVSFDFRLDAVTASEFLAQYKKGTYVCSHDVEFGKGQFERDLLVYMHGELDVPMSWSSYEDALWYAQAKGCVIPSFDMHRLFFVECLRQSIQLQSGGPLLTSTFAEDGSVVLINGPFFEDELRNKKVKRGIPVPMARLNEYRPLLRLARPIVCEGKNMGRR